MKVRTINLFWVCLLLFCSFNLYAQSDTTLLNKASKKKLKKLEVSGYLKYLTSVYVIHQNNPSQVDYLQNNLFHNRINFKWFISDAFTFKAELRNRFFFGDFIKLSPNYAKSITIGDSIRNGYKDYLSWDIYDANGIAVHSILDRIYFKYSYKKWEISIGRQRINWGINTIWNPNDIFNAYSFTDFDYEERPGTDAIRLQYFPGSTSRFEFAISYFDKLENLKTAFLYRFNKWNYDFQFISGVFNGDVAIGLGWAGNIGNLGFNGEASYFYNFLDTNAVQNSFLGTISIDYLFSNRMFLSFSFLYNHNGLLNISSAQLLSFNLSAKNLYPYRYSLALAFNYPLSEALNLGLTSVYSPGESHAMFLTPTLTYFINESWDLNFVAQITFNTFNNYYISPIQVFFLRLRLSF